MSEDLSGWNSELEVGETLASLIRLTKAQTILEVGVFQGATSKQLIQALPKGGYYAGIDIEDFRTIEAEKSFENATKKGKVADFIKESSITALKKLPAKHFDLIFVDSMHHWDHILPEFKLIEPLLADGGLLCYHDSLHIEDVKNLMTYAFSYGYNLINLNTPDNRGLAILKR